MGRAHPATAGAALIVRALAGLLVLSLAACGAGGEAATRPTPAPSAAAANATLPPPVTPSGIAAATGAGPATGSPQAPGGSLTPVSPAPVSLTPLSLTPVSSTPLPHTPMPAMQHGDINLAHLTFLTEPVRVNGQEMSIVHIYSEAPKYEWVDASGEGISALDDVARAAIVYLEYYGQTKDSLALDQARRLLNFTIYMQADDGEYYNFVLDRAGTINRDGNTSYKSWGWWAARGQWALATGYRVFKDVDPAYAKVLQQAYLKGEGALAAKLGKPGTFNDLHGVRVPAWLLDEGSDVSALAMLGLAEYQAAAPNDQTKNLLVSLGDAVAAYQLGGPGEYPFGAHPSAATSTAMWHAWGSHQCHALALAGTLLGKADWIKSAQREADTFFAHQLASDFLNQMGVVPVLSGQIAYGQEVMTSCFVALAKATGNETYRKYAGLTAAWFYGNNMARFAMYDPATGRGFDGIEGPSEFRVNHNAGAESTIEALYALLEVAGDPVASAYLHYRPATGDAPYQVLEAEDGVSVPGKAKPDYVSRDSTGEASFSGGHYYAMPVGSQAQITVTFPAEDDYYVYAAHLRPAAPQPAKAAEALRAPGPVTLDGDLAEWQAAAPVKVNAKENIVRGSAEWEGPEKASFTGYLMWDEANLYVAAAVKAPSYHQTHTGADVWRGDVLWVYLDTTHGGSNVDRKLTLAQTPDGPQVWNWNGGGFVPGAQMTWKQTADGYNYEAAIPWKSLYVDQPADGKVMGFELGRGFGGSGFQDFTGKDPDTASNLAPVTLVTKLSPASQAAAAGGAPAADAVVLRAWLGGASLGHQLWSLAGPVSPDRDYLWLDRLNDKPLHHTAGSDVLTYESAGSDPQRSAVVDAFVILPVVERRVLTDPTGHSLTVVHSLETGKTTLEEK